MDARLVLGIDATAPASEVRSAQRRLRRNVGPGRGGSARLVAVIDAAAAQVLEGTPMPAVNPHLLLGVAVGAPESDVRGAYRRLARVVHPDLGGTDELFRLVAAAADVASGRLSARRARRGRPSWDSWRPTGPPPPRGPYRAPPPDQRHEVPTWRALRDLGGHLTVLTLVVVVVAAASQVHRVLVFGAVIAAGVAWGPILRPALEGVLRAGTVLLGTRVRVLPAVEPERFLEATCIDTPVGRQRHDDLYQAYIRWCRTTARADPVARWVFVERLRTLGLLYVKASGWDDGLWVGVTLRKG